MLSCSKWARLATHGSSVSGVCRGREHTERGPEGNCLTAADEFAYIGAEGHILSVGFFRPRQFARHHVTPVSVPDQGGSFVLWASEIPISDLEARNAFGPPHGHDAIAVIENDIGLVAIRADLLKHLPLHNDIAAIVASRTHI